MNFSFQDKSVRKVNGLFKANIKNYIREQYFK